MAVKAWAPLFALIGLFGLAVNGLFLQHSKPYNQSQPAKSENWNRPIAKSIAEGASSPNTAERKEEKRWYESFFEKPTDTLLVLFNGLLALYTWKLFRATSGLFTETAGLREAAAEQSRDMKASIAVAITAAEAASKSAEVAEQSLISTERAFVFLKYAYASPVLESVSIVAWDFHIVWGNSGSTPTQHLVTYKNWLGLAGELPDDFDFPDNVAGDGEKPLWKTFIGPGSEKDAGGMKLPLDEVKRMASRAERLYMWGWAEYSDIFRPDKRSRSEYCFEIVVTGDPTKIPNNIIKPPFDFVSYKKHNGCESECYRQPGDRIPIRRYQKPDIGRPKPFAPARRAPNSRSPPWVAPYRYYGATSSVPNWRALHVRGRQTVAIHMRALRRAFPEANWMAQDACRHPMPPLHDLP